MTDRSLDEIRKDIDECDQRIVTKATELGRMAGLREAVDLIDYELSASPGHMGTTLKLLIIELRKRILK